MSRFKLSVLLVAGAVGLSACSDDLLTPELSKPSPAVRSAAFAAESAASRHVVLFSGAVPADFGTRVDAMGGEVVFTHSIGIAIVSGLGDGLASQLGDDVQASVVPEPQFHLLEPAAVSSLSPLELTSQSNPAGAILFGQQWNMHQVRAEAAWAAGRLGSPSVSIAILDTGIDYGLPDLAGRVDLSRSASFVPLDDLYTAFYFPGRHVSTDLHYHGTNVATQASSNAWAFAGVTSQTTLMSVKVCGFLGGCPGVVEGILYAVDNGADVINMSLGGWFRKSAFPGQVAVVNAIMNHARKNGVTVVVAAGNDAIDLDRNNNVPIYNSAGEIIDRIHIPSFFSTYCDAVHVICVASTRRNDVPSSFTNYGRSAIDVAAPGGDGVTGDWVQSLCPQTSLLYNCAGGYFVMGVAGTSQAAPHVAGLAALAVEDVGRSPSRVRAYLRNSADAVAGNPGNSPYYGRGRINVARAVGATK